MMAPVPQLVGARDFLRKTGFLWKLLFFHPRRAFDVLKAAGINVSKLNRIPP